MRKTSFAWLYLAFLVCGLVCSHSAVCAEVNPAPSQRNSGPSADGQPGKAEISQQVKPAQPAPPQPDPASAEAAQNVERLKLRSETLRNDFKTVQLPDQALNGMREAAEDIIRQLNDIVEAQQPRATELQARLDALGPVPATGQPPEPEVNATERKAISQSLGFILGPIRAAGGVLFDTKSLLERINRQRRILFADKLLSRVESPLSPSLWRRVIGETRNGIARLSDMASE